MLKNDLKSKIQKSVDTNPKLYHGNRGCPEKNVFFSDYEKCCTSMWVNHIKSVQCPSDSRFDLNAKLALFFIAITGHLI